MQRGIALAVLVLVASLLYPSLCLAQTYETLVIDDTGPFAVHNYQDGTNRYVSVISSGTVTFTATLPLSAPFPTVHTYAGSVELEAPTGFRWGAFMCIPDEMLYCELRESGASGVSLDCYCEPYPGGWCDSADMSNGTPSHLSMTLNSSGC